MKNVIEFKIRPGGGGLHKDFVMKVPSLNKEFFFDTYYFWDGEYETDGYEILIPEIQSYLTKCKNSILKLLDKEYVYLPIDFSDQYYGSFKVTFLYKNTYEFIYGWVEKTMQTSFSEDEDGIHFDIGDTSFHPDFHINLRKEDVVDSFILKKYD